ncbi:MAG: multiple sugar transport system permease protein [Micromonosporaceae bacterium]
MATTSVTVGREARTRASAVPAGDALTRWYNGFCLSVLLVFAAVWLIPLLWAVDTSLRPEGEIATNPTSWWSSHFSLDAYRAVWNAGDMPKWYLNSAITAVLSAAAAVVVASMAGFALSKVDFSGRRWMFLLVLAGIMIPPQVLIVPMFREFGAMHLLNTYWSIILPAIPTPLAVFVFKQFFDGLPTDLVEAAQMDGASWWRVYRRICLPLTRPAISAVAIFTFVWTWNAFLWPLLTLSSPDVMTIPVGLGTVQSAFGIHYAQIMASAVLGALPLLVVFIVFQRRIVEGIVGTGLKG